MAMNKTDFPSGVKKDDDDELVDAATAAVAATAPPRTNKTSRKVGTTNGIALVTSSMVDNKD